MSKNKDIKITIIIPVYNVEKYITRCLSSVINQTLRGIYKVILINDGSSDNSGSICIEYSQKYPELIQYISQDNVGLGATRNVGLRLVDTPYICFLDSDDWLEPRFFEKIMSIIGNIDEEPDMIFTLPNCYDEISKKMYPWMDEILFKKIFYKNNSNKILNSPELYLLEVNANRKIYKTSFLMENNFSFPEGVKWEDIRPHIELIHKAKSIIGVSSTGFVYRTNVAGQITAGTGKGRLDIISVFDDVLSIIDDTYSSDELAHILSLICNYSFWMLDMTNMDYIKELLDGLHAVFSKISLDMIKAFETYDWSDINDKNKKMAFIDFMQKNNYLQLDTYESRNNLYRYWSINGIRKNNNIILGGIQCIKDSGFKYTLRLFIKKLLKKELYN